MEAAPEAKYPTREDLLTSMRHSALSYTDCIALGVVVGHDPVLCTRPSEDPHRIRGLGPP